MNVRYAMDHGSGIVEIVWIFLIALVWVAVIAAIALGIRWLIRNERGSGSPRSPGLRPDDPLEILRGRYARGEIDDEEFERRRRMLGG